MDSALIFKLWGPLATVAMIFAVRLHRARREKPLRRDRLWIAPALLAIFAAGMLALHPPHVLGWTALTLGMALGVPIGTRRGRMIRIRRNPTSGQLLQQSRRLAVLILMALVLTRFALHFLLEEGSPPEGLHQGATLLGDLLLGAALGIVTGTRLDLYRRAGRLQTDAGA